MASKFWTEEERKLLEKYILSGKRVKDCAELLGRSTSSIRQARQRYNLPPFDKHAPIRWKGEQRRILGILRSQGKSRQQIADYFGISPSGVGMILDRYGLPTKTYRQVTQSESHNIEELYSTTNMNYAAIAYRIGWSYDDGERVRSHVDSLVKRGTIKRRQRHVAR